MVALNPRTELRYGWLKVKLGGWKIIERKLERKNRFWCLVRREMMKIFWWNPNIFFFNSLKIHLFKIGEKTKVKAPISKQWLNCAPNFNASYASHLPPRNMSRLLNLCCPVLPSLLFIKKREKRTCPNQW